MPELECARVPVFPTGERSTSTRCSWLCWSFCSSCCSFCLRSVARSAICPPSKNNWPFGPKYLSEPLVVPRAHRGSVFFFFFFAWLWKAGLWGNGFGRCLAGAPSHAQFSTPRGIGQRFMESDVVCSWQQKVLVLVEGTSVQGQSPTRKPPRQKKLFPYTLKNPSFQS